MNKFVCKFKKQLTLRHDFSGVERVPRVPVFVSTEVIFC